MDYTSLSDTINSTLATGVSTFNWKNVPGGLEKVSESSIGVVWGVGSGKLYYCNMPCTGKWQLSDIQDVIDVATDDDTVFALQKDKLSFKSANNVDNWITIPATNITKIFVTRSYIWGSGSNFLRLAKPGTTGNWVNVTLDSKVKITSSSMGALYGVDGTGIAYKTDESGQSGWVKIPQFKGKYSGIFGEGDTQAIYGATATSLDRCEGDKCKTIPTENPATFVQLQPRTKNVWMISGKGENIFTKKDAIDSSLLNDVRPLDSQRVDAVNRAKLDYEKTTMSGIVSKQLAYVRQFLEDNMGKKSDISELKDQAKVGDYQYNSLKNALKLTYEILLILIFVVIVYAMGGIFGPMTHFIAFGIIAAGTIYFIINNGGL